MKIFRFFRGNSAIVHQVLHIDTSTIEKYNYDGNRADESSQVEAIFHHIWVRIMFDSETRINLVSFFRSKWELLIDEPPLFLWMSFGNFFFHFFDPYTENLWLIRIHLIRINGTQFNFPYFLKQLNWWMLSFVHPGTVFGMDIFHIKLFRMKSKVTQLMKWYPLEQFFFFFYFCNISTTNF